MRLKERVANGLVFDVHCLLQLAKESRQASHHFHLPCRCSFKKKVHRQITDWSKIVLQEFLSNVLHNMFKPLLLFFYAGFLVPLLKVNIEFPKAAYQALTIYLLLAIGWHGGEELAGLEPAMYGQAFGFMIIGFFANLVIGITAYTILRWTTSLRKIDAATVAGYYGSDSAGTFVTCLGMLTAAQIAFAPYMPVLLAVMEIPGCLVALYLVSKFRKTGMDTNGNMPEEAGYVAIGRKTELAAAAHIESGELHESVVVVRNSTGVAVESRTMSHVTVGGGHRNGHGDYHHGGDHHSSESWSEQEQNEDARELEQKLGLQHVNAADDPSLETKSSSWLNRELLHEVFLNPGIYLLFAGIAIGFISRLQGDKVTTGGDALFNSLFQGCLCLFLLEMGITASSKIKDLKIAGWRFVAFALLAPNLFACFGIAVAHAYSLFLGQPLAVGTYVLFAVLCGAASYIAVPAVQRLAIPEASPTLPLAASLVVTFTYNVTFGIPLYLLVAQTVVKTFPVHG